MPKRDTQALKAPRPSPPLSAEDREIAAILAQADSELDAGQGYSNNAATRFLDDLLTNARARLAPKPPE